MVLILLVVTAFLVYKFAFKKVDKPREKPKPVAVSKHSEAFNESVKSVLTYYYQMTDGFVNWNVEAVNKTATGLKMSLDSFKVEELKKDSTIYQTALFPLDNAKNNIASIIASSDWQQRRRALQDLSDNLRMLLLTVKYDDGIIYWQECPMAFGEGQLGNWLSEKEEILNPYLGKKDPKYGESMLNCGETKMKIDFTAQDTIIAL